jgi:hypothetical protein
MTVRDGPESAGVGHEPHSLVFRRLKRVLPLDIGAGAIEAHHEPSASSSPTIIHFDGWSWAHSLSLARSMLVSPVAPVAPGCRPTLASDRREIGEVSEIGEGSAMGWRGLGDCRVCVRLSDHNEARKTGVRFPGSARFCAWAYEVVRLRIHLYLRWIDLGKCVVASWVGAHAPGREAGMSFLIVREPQIE